MQANRNKTWMLNKKKLPSNIHETVDNNRNSWNGWEHLRLSAMCNAKKKTRGGYRAAPYPYTHTFPGRPDRMVLVSTLSLNGVLMVLMFALIT